MHVETIAYYLYAKENKREKQDWHLPREQSPLFTRETESMYRKELKEIKEQNNEK